MKKWKIIKHIIFILYLFMYFWTVMPPLNIRSLPFWSFVLSAVGVYLFLSIFDLITLRATGNDLKIESFSFSKAGKIAGVSFVIILLGMIVISISGSRLFNSDRYAKMIVMEDGNFSKDVAELTKGQIPVVDKDSAARLGLRKLGEMSDLVSQFEVRDNYTQINYKGRAVRVTPLGYGDMIKWFNNQKNGVPAYITVDMTTQETSLIRLSEGMRYSESEYFMRNIYRYLRFCYPTKIYDTIEFEIDENGTPYWIAGTVTYRIGFWGGRDIEGAVLVNAITGEHHYYDIEEVPSWVDRVYDADMVITQLNNNGLLRNGYWNSHFGQKGVLQTTDGYNYLAINDDVYLYTGMTSVGSDESNVGFVLANLRTKETKYYAIPGAEEFSAMESAEGQVQHLGYVSTFPLLLNISGRPSYFVSLKDSAGLVKMYAFVDVQQYQIVGTGNTVDEARKDYLSKLSGSAVVIEQQDTNSITGTVKRISSAVVEGNTVYFVLLENSNELFQCPIQLNSYLSMAESGDTLKITYYTNDAEAVVTGVEVTLQ